MASIYVLKIHTDGYPAEMDPATVTPGDILQLPGTKFSDDIDLGHNSILNLATPVNPDDGVNKAYVDAIASGLDPHESVVVKTDHKLGSQALVAGAGGTGIVNLTTGDGMTIAIDGETPVPITLASIPADRAAAITAINSRYATAGGLGGTIAYAGSGLYNINIRSNTYGDDSAVALTSVHANWAELGVTAGTSDGASFTPSGAYPNHIYTGPTNGVAWNTIDGFTLTSTGQRVLVSMEGGDDAAVDKNNGVYYVSQLATAGLPLILHRSLDADTGNPGELVQGLYVFVSDGTAGTNTGWTMVTPGTISVDTTPLKFAQFSGAPGLTYDQGLKRSVNSIVVELDASANAQGQGAPTADRHSGLEFDADTASGKLRVAVAPAGGLERYQTTPFGLSVKLNNTSGDNTLGLTSDGIKVLGLPSAFTIDNTPVNPLVTAANLTVLVNGSETTLHSHPGAGEAERLEYTFTTDGSVALGDPVYMTSAGKVQKADAGVDSKAFACGIAREGKADGELCNITIDGIAKAVFTADKTIGIRWYVANGGGLTSTVPGSTKHVMQMGFTSAVRDLLVQKQYIGKKV